MSRDSFLNRFEGKPSASHRRAPKMEKEIAKRIGGRITPGSGNKDVKGDVRLKRVVRIEAKTTKNKSFSVTLDMLQKIEDAALPCDELPVLIIEFNDGNGRKVREVAVVPTYILDSLGYTT